MHYYIYLKRWIRTLASLCHPIRSQSEVNHNQSSRSRNPALLPVRRVCFESLDWLTGLSVLFLIGQSDYFGYGFTLLERKPL